MYSTIDRIEYDVTGRAACFIYVRVKTRIQFALQDGDFHSTKKGYSIWYSQTPCTISIIDFVHNCTTV